MDLQRPNLGIPTTNPQSLCHPSHIDSGEAQRVTQKPGLELPTELIKTILEYLSPHSPISVYNSNGESVKLNRELLVSRVQISNLCLVNRRLGSISCRFLYRCVILQNQIELVCFLRTLVETPCLRRQVFTLTWAGTLSHRILPDLMDPDGQMQPFMSQYWAGVNWPPLDEQVLVSHLGMKTPESFAGWQVFAAVLGLIPCLKSLFTTLGRLSRVSIPLRTPESPEALAIWQLFGTFPEQITSCPAPTSVSFLQNIETITFEPDSYKKIAECSQVQFLRDILRKSKSLKRVQLKGEIAWVLLLTQPNNFRSTPQSQYSHLEDLKIIHSQQPQTSFHVISQIFPNLRSIAAEFKEGSSDAKNRSDSASDREVSNALHSLKDSLEYLRLSTTPGETWARKVFPPLLSPGLGQMSTLKSLTTECLWLFGRQNPEIAFDVKSLLPSCLTNLHIIDYWGWPHYNGMFWPDFPRGLNILGFMTEMLQDLRQGCDENLKSLTRVKITSHAFSPVLIGKPCRPENFKEVDTQQLITRFERDFASSGVNFSVSMPTTTLVYGQKSWGST